MYTPGSCHWGEGPTGDQQIVHSNEAHLHLLQHQAPLEIMPGRRYCFLRAPSLGRTMCADHVMTWGSDPQHLLPSHTSWHQAIGACVTSFKFGKYACGTLKLTDGTCIESPLGQDVKDCRDF